MPIAYLDQATYVREPTFRAQVEAGTMIVALSVDTLPPISGVAAQQRQDFADRVISSSNISAVTFGVDQFCWAIVGVKQLSDIGKITDNQINTVITANWDRIAQAMIPAGGP